MDAAAGEDKLEVKLVAKRVLRGRAQRPYSALVLSGNESSLISECLAKRSWWRSIKTAEGDDITLWNFWWGGNGQCCPYKRFNTGPRRLVCRVPGNREVVTKWCLAAQMAKYAELLGRSLPFMPETYMFSAKLQVVRERQLLQAAATRAAEDGRGTIWIVKPNSRNRGNGISVQRSVDDVFKFINNQAMGSTWVVQKYIEKPLLLGGRKFDIRSYVLITPDRQVFFYNDSYVRTSSALYTLADLEDRSIHLTNDAIQKKYDHYNQFEDHNKISMTGLQEVLDKQGAGISVQDDLYPEMKAAARHVFSAVIPSLNAQNMQYCFELMGLDFMVDENKQVYLIEVNTCPALQRHGQVLKDMLPFVMEEIVQKAVDPFYPPEDSSELPEPLNNFELLDLTPFERPTLVQRSRTMERVPLPPRDPSPRRATIDHLARNRTLSSFASRSHCSEVLANAPQSTKARVGIVPTKAFRT